MTMEAIKVKGLDPKALEAMEAVLLDRLGVKLRSDTAEAAALAYLSVSHSKASQDVLAERSRQLSEEGWTLAHDDEHVKGEMAAAAICYAAGERLTHGPFKQAPYGWHSWWWPWEDRWWKRQDRRRNLVKAGALILAEIERLDRMK